ncbi:transcriptional regulator, partial [Klebsiella pneumoniae]
TLHRLIKAGDLSTCSGERNAKMVDTSELLRVFGPFEQPKGEHHSGQVSGQRDTASADQSEQVIRHLKQEIEHLNTLLLSKDSHIDSLKQAMLLLENHQAKLTESPAPWWKFWKKS